MPCDKCPWHKVIHVTDLDDVGSEDVEGKGVLGVEDGGHLDLEAALRNSDLLLGHHLHGK